MKVVINRCYGGFGLSPKAKKRLAELEGRKCFFFLHDWKTSKYTPISAQEANKSSDLIFAFDVADPNVAIEKDEEGEFYAKHSIDDSRYERHNPLLVQVVKELNKKAYGAFAELRVVEVPDGVAYKIDDYDGMESIHEVHRSWS